MKQAIEMTLMFVVAMCLFIGVGATFGGPILLAYGVATITGLAMSIVACAVIGFVAMTIVVHFE